jgi:enterochelin esterase family protein
VVLLIERFFGMSDDIAQESVSPRITVLQQAIKNGRAGVLGEFWDEVKSKGAPLIEPIEGDEQHYLVTFLWRDENGETENVVLGGGPAGWWNFRQHMLVKLPESDLFYKTYRLRSDLRTTYQLSANDSLVEFPDAEDVVARIADFKADPLNPQHYIHLKDEEADDDFEMIRSVLELPDAPVRSWLALRSDVPQGKLEKFRLKSTTLENERRVWIYTPAGYDPDRDAYGLFLLFDGDTYIAEASVTTTLDNLIHEGKIPPLVVVLPESLSSEVRNRELPCYPPFVDYLVEELLPWVHTHYHVTDDPSRTIVGGASYGGLAATFVGLKASHVFGNVLSQSGSFWWSAEQDSDGFKAKEHWLNHQFAISPRLPVRFYMEVGLLERSPQTDMVISNHYMRDVLLAKGYDVTYSEFHGGHDHFCWQGSLADGLLCLTR